MQQNTLPSWIIRKVQVPESRGRSKNCSLCNKEFGLFVAEHQCKRYPLLYQRCKRAVCEKCSPSKAIAIKVTGPSKTSHRQCNICKEESQRIQEFIETNKIQFLSDSYSISWLSAFNYDIGKAQDLYSKALNFCLQDDAFVNQFKPISQQAFNEFLYQANYSLREFFQMVLKDIQREKIQKCLLRILKVFWTSHPQVGKSSDQLLITLYLLCFCSEPVAYTLLVLLHEEIIPPNIYPSNQLEYEFQFEIQKMNSILSMETYSKQSKNFIQKKLGDYINILTLNLLTFQCGFRIWEELFVPQQGWLNLLKALSLLFAYHDLDKADHEEVMLEILRTTTLSLIGDSLGYMSKSKVQDKFDSRIPRTKAHTVVLDNMKIDIDQMQNSLKQTQPIRRKDLQIQNVTLKSLQVLAENDATIEKKKVDKNTSSELEAQQRKQSQMSEQLKLLSMGTFQGAQQIETTITQLQSQIRLKNELIDKLTLDSQTKQELIKDYQFRINELETKILNLTSSFNQSPSHDVDVDADIQLAQNDISSLSNHTSVQLQLFSQSQKDNLSPQQISPQINDRFVLFSSQMAVSNFCSDKIQDSTAQTQNQLSDEQIPISQGQNDNQLNNSLKIKQLEDKIIEQQELINKLQNQIQQETKQFQKDKQQIKQEIVNNLSAQYSKSVEQLKQQLNEEYQLKLSKIELQMKEQQQQFDRQLAIRQRTIGLLETECEDLEQLNKKISEQLMNSRKDGQKVNEDLIQQIINKQSEELQFQQCEIEANRNEIGQFADTIEKLKIRDREILNQFRLKMSKIVWLDQQQIYSFTDSKFVKKNNIFDEDDFKLQIQTQALQISQLKKLLVEKQQQLGELHNSMIEIRNLLENEFANLL